MALLEVCSLQKYFPLRSGILGRKQQTVKAVDEVTLEVHKGETLGLVGESGCGKSTLGRCIIRLIEPTGGKIYYDGKELTRMTAQEMRKVRRKIQMIFQDPYASLNPRMRVGDIIAEGLKIHNISKGENRKHVVMSLLNRVGLREEHYTRYPHEFSGGQRQRIGVARALAVNAECIIADEAVSALDVSIQAQVLNLITDLQKEFNLTYLFISHDLRVVEHISDRVAVMYLGKVVEIASAKAIYNEAVHPYTKALMSAVPTTDPSRIKKRILLEGDVPSPINPPKGCSFHPRCRFAEQICKTKPPSLVTYGDHSVACHLFTSQSA